MYHKILLPLDGSELAAQALPCGLEIALRFDAELILLVAVSVPRAIAIGPEMHIPVDYETLLDYESRQAEAYLEHKRRDLEAAGVRVRTVVRTGPPEEAIVDLAADDKVDLVLMSSHGRSGLSRWILGSVTHKVLESCSVPVLVLKRKT
ncbi:MAG: universal stress protein [Armatimonadetes bacterium]|nr:universal stress protein [Armatimonadota bacterium]